jgi:putative hydrolase of the HAD superfamily
MPKIKGVLLDLDHTLYDYEVCNEAALKVACKRLSDRFGLPVKEIERSFESARHSVKIDLTGTGSEHSRTLYFKKLVENVEERTDPGLILELEDLYWKEYFSLMKLFPHVREFLEYCRRKKLRVAIVTDLTAAIQLRKIVFLGIEDLIDYVVTSEEAGKEKPSPYLFYIAMDRLKCRPDEVIMVGDDCEKDVLAARNLGINSFHLSNKSVWRDYEKWLQ